MSLWMFDQDRMDNVGPDPTAWRGSAISTCVPWTKSLRRMGPSNCSNLLYYSHRPHGCAAERNMALWRRPGHQGKAFCMWAFPSYSPSGTRQAAWNSQDSKGFL